MLLGRLVEFHPFSPDLCCTSCCYEVCPDDAASALLELNFDLWIDFRQVELHLILWEKAIDFLPLEKVPDAVLD